MFELAGHFEISIGLTLMLIDGRGDLQPARDRTSFFINPRSETGPVVYEYAYRAKPPAPGADYAPCDVEDRRAAPTWW